MTIFVSTIAFVFRYVCKSSSIGVQRLQVLVLAVLTVVNEFSFIVAGIWSCFNTPLLSLFYTQGSTRSWAVAIASESPQLSTPLSYILVQQVLCPYGGTVKLWFELYPIFGIGQDIVVQKAKYDARLLAALREKGFYETEDGMIHDLAEGWFQSDAVPRLTSGEAT